MASHTTQTEVYALDTEESFFCFKTFWVNMKLFMVNILKVMERIKDRNHALKHTAWHTTGTHWTPAKPSSRARKSTGSRGSDSGSAAAVLGNLLTLQTAASRLQNWNKSNLLPRIMVCGPGQTTLPLCLTVSSFLE